MYSFINAGNIKIDAESKEKLGILSSQWMNHRFALLGSEMLKMDYALDAPGFCGVKYTSRTMGAYGVMDKLLPFKSHYKRINWFVDFKTGFFFDPVWFNSRQRCCHAIGEQIGVDIKCPWELGRLYHLVDLSIYAHVASDEQRRKIVQEFFDEIMDFIYSNPIGRTVQWSAPMDVSIRIVNILISFDIMKQADRANVLNQKFEQSLTQHIKKSGEYILQNLEYTGKVESNHYLSNLAGLIFAASYLPASQETDAWLVFATQELIDQVEAQFYEEGSHFEGSTSYHRLSAEFVLYATALIYGVLNTERKSAFREYDNSQVRRLRNLHRQRYDVDSDSFFPQWYTDRLCNIGKFTESVLKQNNEIIQVGDNDSGRLIKLTPLGKICLTAEVQFQEDVLDHRSLLSLLSGLFSNRMFEQYGEKLPLESSLIRELSKAPKIQGTVYNTEIDEWGEDIDLEYAYRKDTVLFSEDDTAPSLLEGAQMEYYEKFGIMIVKSVRMFLGFVIDTTQHSRLYGHTHNDKMSLELFIDGNYITRDPGGYIYTAFPEIRNKFRSTMAHNCIHIKDKEQNALADCFEMKKRATGELIYCDKGKIVGKAIYLDVEHMRKIYISPHKIVVCDLANQPFTVKFKNTVVSKGYGRLEHT